MLRRCYLYFFVCLLSGLMGCHHSPLTSLPSLPTTSTHNMAQIRPLVPYNNVIVQGPVNIILHTGDNHPRVVLRGDSRDLPQVFTAVRNNTLFVSVGKGYPKFSALTADIYTRSLTSFIYDGVGTISGSNLNTQRLNLSITNTGNTNLAGHINLQRLVVRGAGNVQLNGVSGHDIAITMMGDPHIQLVGVFNLNILRLNGNGFLSGYWIKNDRLVVRQHGRVHVQFAGTVNVMDVELWGQSDFNGRYLRANRAFVKTHDHSVARLSAVNRQHTLASDASDIYFYNLPEMKTDFMAYNGAVLDMRDWNLFAAQEYTIYNKYNQ